MNLSHKKESASYVMQCRAVLFSIFKICTINKRDDRIHLVAVINKGVVAAFVVMRVYCDVQVICNAVSNVVEPATI